MKNVTLQRTNIRKLITRDQSKLLSDLELLCHLCSVSEDKEAYNEFVHRFYDEMKAECERRCLSRKLDKHIGTQIAHDTFERVKHHKTFREDKIKVADSHKGILAYLIRISVNLFNDHYRKEKKVNLLSNHKMYFDDLIGPLEIENDAIKLKQIREVTQKMFKSLNPKEQKVVIADIENKKHQKYLPDDVIDRLAEELNVKRDTVRKIRERAIEKIKTAIDEFNQA